MRLDSEHDFRLPLLRCGANSYFHTEGVDGVGKGALSPPYRHASCLTSGPRKSEFQFSFSAEAGAGKDEEPLRSFCAVERGKPTQGAQPLLPLSWCTGRPAGKSPLEPCWDPPPFPVHSLISQSPSNAVSCYSLCATPVETLAVFLRPGKASQTLRAQPSIHLARGKCPVPALSPHCCQGC